MAVETKKAVLKRFIDEVPELTKGGKTQSWYDRVRQYLKEDFGERFANKFNSLRGSHQLPYEAGVARDYLTQLRKNLKA